MKKRKTDITKKQNNTDLKVVALIKRQKSFHWASPEQNMGTIAADITKGKQDKVN